MTQNLINFSLDAESNSEDDLGQHHLDLLFKNILIKTSQIPALKKLIHLETKTQTTAQSIGTGKLISKKMRTKLLNWMQNLALETFSFSLDTLLHAIKILDEYLCLTNESPAELQLIGSASLYLAAKTSEVVIVASQCYVVASANCFTEEQLISKQLEIFKTLNYNTTFSSLSRVYKYMKINEISSNSINNLKNEVSHVFLEIAKNLDFLQWRQHKVVSMFIVLAHVKNQLPQANDVLEKLRSCSSRG